MTQHRRRRCAPKLFLLAATLAAGSTQAAPSRLAQMVARLRGQSTGDGTSAPASAPATSTGQADSPQPDELLFASGERVHGTITGVKGGVVTFSAFQSKAIQADLASLVDIHQNQELVVQLDTETELRGYFRRDGSPGTFLVETKAGLRVVVKPERILRVATPAAWAAEYAALLEKGTERLSKYWKGYIDAGYASSTGQIDTQEGKVQMEATRVTSVDKFRLNVFTQQSSANGQKTADKTYGEGRFDVYMKDRLFYFLQGRLETDEIRNLDLRTAIGGGFGYKLVDRPGNKLDLGLGYSFVREAFNSGLDNSQGTLLLTLDVDRDFTERVGFEWRLSANPDFGSPSDLLLKSVATIKSKITGDLSFTVGHVYNYDKVPPAGGAGRDITITTGLRKDF